ncbi:MAG: 6-phosphogluconolactonase [Microthrixaceae bacterium]
MRVQRVEDGFHLACARALATELSAAQRGRREVSLALSGGPTVGPVFDALVALAAKPPSAEVNVDWGRVLIGQVDERIVALGHPDRNAADLLDRLVRPLGIPEHRVQLLPVELVSGGQWLERAALGVAEAAGMPPTYDLMQLGLGPDGHTASLVPGDPVLDATESAVACTRPYQGCRRLTLTYPVINAARRRVWWIPDAGPGGDTAEALKLMLAGDRSIPAGCVVQANSVVVAQAPEGGDAAS